MTQPDDGSLKEGCTGAAGTCLEVVLEIQVSAGWPSGTTERPPSVGRASTLVRQPVSCLFPKSSAASTFHDLEQPKSNGMPLLMTLKGTVICDAQHDLSTHPLGPSPPRSSSILSSHLAPRCCLDSRTSLSFSYLEHPSPCEFPQIPSYWPLANHEEDQLSRQGDSLTSTETPT